MPFVMSCGFLISLFVLSANDIVVPVIAWIFAWVIFAMAFLVGVFSDDSNKRS